MVLLVNDEGNQVEVLVTDQKGPIEGTMVGIDQNGDKIVIFDKDIICVLKGH